MVTLFSTCRGTSPGLKYSTHSEGRPSRPALPLSWSKWNKLYQQFFYMEELDLAILPDNKFPLICLSYDGWQIWLKKCK